MTEQGTRTPAQQRWEMSITKRDAIGAAFQRAEEIASDVRSLAATVDDDMLYVRAAIDGISCRLAALESPGSAEAAPGRKPCPRCLGDGGVPENRLAYMHQGYRDCPDCDGSGFVPAEAAPEDLCSCLRPRSQCCPYCCTDTGKDIPDAPESSANRCPDCGGDGLAKYTDPNAVTWHHCQTCYGAGLVPAEQAVQEPPALDPVLVLTSDELEMLREIVNARTSGTGGLIMSTQIDYRELALGMINRAYGGDAREGGKSWTAKEGTDGNG